MMDIDLFLKNFFERYLIKDLRSMARIRPKKRGGSVGYPMVLTTMSGIELLGGLLSTNQFNAFAGDRYFSNYWRNYLAPSSGNPKYNINNIDVLVYQLARHGIAHSFVAKEGIVVTKEDRTNHLIMDTSTNQLVIDSTQFADDFISSYENRVKPIVAITTGAVNKTTMQDRLNEMASIYNGQSATAFRNIPSQPQIVFPYQFNAGTASFTSLASGTRFGP